MKFSIEQLKNNWVKGKKYIEFDYLSEKYKKIEKIIPKVPQIEGYENLPCLQYVVCVDRGVSEESSILIYRKKDFEERIVSKASFTLSKPSAIASTIDLELNKIFDRHKEDLNLVTNEYHKAKYRGYPIKIFCNDESILFSENVFYRKIVIDNFSKNELEKLNLTNYNHVYIDYQSLLLKTRNHVLEEVRCSLDLDDKTKQNLLRYDINYESLNSLSRSYLLLINYLENKRNYIDYFCDTEKGNDLL